MGTRGHFPGCVVVHTQGFNSTKDENQRQNMEEETRESRVTAGSSPRDCRCLAELGHYIAGE